MRTFYVPPENIIGDEALVTESEFYHAVRVLRMKAGEKLRLVDGRGFEYIGIIREIVKGERELKVEVLEKRSCARDPEVKITLAQALLKGERMDYVVEKATELGVSLIIPLITERTVRRPESSPERWKRIAISAMKQCGRATLPEIREPVKIGEFVIGELPESKFVAWPSAEKSVRDLEVGREMVVLVGPEGGLTEREITMLCDRGFVPFRLGKRILRGDTAGIASLALFAEKKGEL